MKKADAGPRIFLVLILLPAAVLPGAIGCALFTTRPVQEMSDTAAAMRAAADAQADTLAPQLYQKATELFNQSKRDYKFKNFKEAKEEADKARRYAEQAEFEALRLSAAGASADTAPADTAAPANDSGPPQPDFPANDYATPTGTPAHVQDFPPDQSSVSVGGPSQPSPAPTVSVPPAPPAPPPIPYQEPNPGPTIPHF